MVDTAVVRQADRLQAQLSRDWEIWGPNGGYIAAIALRAAGAATALPNPASFSGHFLNVAAFDAIDIEVVTLRAAKRAESLRVSLSQNGRPIFEAIVWVVADGDGLAHDFAEMPAVPRPDQLRPFEDLIPPEDLKQRYRFWQNLEQRPIDFIPWPQRRPGSAEFREWYRFRPRARCGDAFADAARVLLLIDTMGWPAVCRAHPTNGSWIAPSLDVYAQFHRPATEHDWLLVDATAPVAAGGVIGGQARVWSEDGALLASGGGQLLCRPVPQPA